MSIVDYRFAQFYCCGVHPYTTHEFTAGLEHIIGLKKRLPLVLLAVASCILRSMGAGSALLVEGSVWAMMQFYNLHTGDLAYRSRLSCGSACSFCIYAVVLVPDCQRTARPLNHRGCCIALQSL